MQCNTGELTKWQLAFKRLWKKKKEKPFLSVTHFSACLPDNGFPRHDTGSIEGTGITINPCNSSVERILKHLQSECFSQHIPLNANGISWRQKKGFSTRCRVHLFISGLCDEILFVVPLRVTWWNYKRSLALLISPVGSSDVLGGFSHLLKSTKHLLHPGRSGFDQTGSL